MSRIPDKVMAQSHTSMSCFETCPRQYEARYVTKEVRFEQGVEAAWGGRGAQGTRLVDGQLISRGTPPSIPRAGGGSGAAE
jgi:hypothetical protein